MFVFFETTGSGVLGGNRRNNSTRTTTTTITERPLDLLSKFHQNDYKLIFERSELIRSNASFGNFQLRTFKYNRTAPVVNGSFTYTVDLGNDLEIITQVYKFASNEYRVFPMRFELNFCQAIARNAFGLNTLSKKSGNIVCPAVKGKTYIVKNFVPDGSKFPPLVPSAKYMLELQFLWNNEELFVIYNYGTIERPIPYI